MSYIFVGLGGLMGALCRYLTSIVINDSYLPLSTLAVNLLGCYLLGILTFLQVRSLNSRLRLALSTGFLGSYTTFSTFSIEVLYLINQSRYLAAALYVFISIIGGLLLALLGMLTADRINILKSLPGDE
ncbi:MAG: fluoride efflux transporter CrcB [Desulfotomaculum sp.]|nr:fluoride efflux transporter CrcB [Desulfotomaculum sp.]